MPSLSYVSPPPTGSTLFTWSEEVDVEISDCVAAREHLYRDKDVPLRTCAIAGRMGMWPLQLDPPPQSFGLGDAVIV